MDSETRGSAIAKLYGGSARYFQCLGGHSLSASVSTSPIFLLGMSDDARKQPKFPWDYDVPNNTFWNDLEYVVGRNFLQCYTEDEIRQMPFDETLPAKEKLKYLGGLLEKTFTEKEKQAAPTPLHDANYKAWEYLKLAMSTVEKFLGDEAKEEKIVREMYENGPDGKKSMSAAHQLGGLFEEHGKYAEAEQMERLVLPWMRGHELLGKDSPHALSSLRCLAKSIWKQERYEEADGLIEEYRGILENMDQGKFAKYRDTETRLFEEMVKDLNDWKGKHGMY